MSGGQEIKKIRWPKITKSPCSWHFCHLPQNCKKKITKNNHQCFTIEKALSERNACLPKGDMVADRLQTSVYDTLPPVAVTTGYAIYVSGAQTAVSL